MITGKGQIREMIGELLSSIAGSKLFPYEKRISGWGKTEYMRHEVGADRAQGCFAKTWLGDDDRWHVTYDFDSTFETPEEAMKHLDSILLKYGAVFVDEKLIPMV